MPLSRIWKLSASDAGYTVLGSCGSLLNGAVFPVWGVLLTKVTVLFFNLRLGPEEMKAQASIWAGAFYIYIYIYIYGYIDIYIYQETRCGLTRA